MSIRVFRDPWGIPHLHAESADELAFAQGRVTARDRAWQIEVERHRSWLGPRRPPCRRCCGRAATGRRRRPAHASPAVW